MNKHNSLRGFLTESVPELKRNPDALQIHMDKGHLVARHGVNLGFEYRFNLSLTVLDFNGHPDTIFLPLLLWIRRNEPALLQNYDKGNRGIAFEVDVIDEKSVDLAIDFPLTEAVDVLPKVTGPGYECRHREEPPIAGQELLIDPAALLKQIYITHDGLPAEFLIGYAPAEP